MQTLQPNLEGVGEISLRRLVEEARRMRPSRIVVGEVRQEECLDLSQNALDVWRLALGHCPEGARRADQGLGCTT